MHGSTENFNVSEQNVRPNEPKEEAQIKPGQHRSNDDVALIANHFGQFFRPVLAIQPEERMACHEIRHNVYCEELKFEPPKEDRQERDEFDNFSIFCLIQHIAKLKYAGCVRLVCPSDENQLLPIEQYCGPAIEGCDKHPKMFDRNNICEISRLAVPESFRRRRIDKHEGASVGVINEETYSETEMRCFPFIAIGLYLSAAAMCHELEIDNVFVMMEPRLARSIRFVGINFEQLGPTIEYHGKRAPYYIQPKSLFKTLSPGFKTLLQNIDIHLAPQKENLTSERLFPEN